MVPNQSNQMAVNGMKNPRHFYEPVEICKRCSHGGCDVKVKECGCALHAVSYFVTQGCNKDVFRPLTIPICSPFISDVHQFNPTHHLRIVQFAGQQQVGFSYYQ